MPFGHLWNCTDTLLVPRSVSVWMRGLRRQDLKPHTVEDRVTSVPPSDVVKLLMALALSHRVPDGDGTVRRQAKLMIGLVDSWKGPCAVGILDRGMYGFRKAVVNLGVANLGVRTRMRAPARCFTFIVHVPCEW